MNNTDWVLNELQDSPATPTQKKISRKSSKAAIFRELQQVETITKETDLSNQWLQLLQGDLGLTEPALKQMMLQRPDFDPKNFEYLSETDQKIVTQMKAKYGLNG